MGVIKHNCTMDEIRSAGITTHPLPMSVVLNFKFDSDGKIAKRKVRMTIAGHPGAVTKGIHYQETYSATPVQHTNRLLQAIMVLNRWKRLTLDVRQAFLNADLEEGRKFAVRYPSGLRRYDNQGREMHMILLKNCYGLPQASRSWSRHRDEELLKIFSSNKSNLKWTISKCLKDPCLFKVTMESKGKIHTALFQAHVDDLDCIGSSDEILENIFKLVNERWKSERTDDSYCLGVKRTIVETQEEMTVELTQTAFIEGLAVNFPEHVWGRKVRTPLPEKFALDESVDPKDPKTEDEAKEVIGLGYQKIFGSILWSARHSQPETLGACSLLGSVVSKPTHQAMQALIHLMNYVIQHKSQGIKFSSKGNPRLIAFVDASNKPDLRTGRCVSGHVIMLANGPVVFHSKKMPLVGLSAAQNEYCGMSIANRAIAWLLDLLEEIGFLESMMGGEPVQLFGDNKAANLLTLEDIITAGNQHIAVHYHWSKEMQRLGRSNINFVRSADNIADLFTKSTSRQVLERLLAKVLGYDPDPKWMELLFEQNDSKQ